MRSVNLITPRVSATMRVINRTAISLVGVQPYIDWIRSRDADFNKGSLTVARTKPYGSAFLLPEFELEEAHQIVMSATPLKYREDDSHDVIGTFNAIMASRNKPLADTREAFERQLLDWNAQVIFSRRSKNPGHWKERGNQAGNTVFVSPPLVLGTLAKGFELPQSASDDTLEALVLCSSRLIVVVASSQ